MSISTIGNETRLAALRDYFAREKPVRIVEVHSPLAAVIAEHAQGKGPDKREFHGFWSSSLTDSALRGLPDIELLDMELRLSWIDQIFSVSTLPLVMDGDTGGQTLHFEHMVKAMERRGVSAVVIEDKAGEKRNSLLPGDGLHTMARVDEFCEKISRGKAAQSSTDFMIIARLEGSSPACRDRRSWTVPPPTWRPERTVWCSTAAARTRRPCSTWPGSCADGTRAPPWWRSPRPTRP